MELLVREQRLPPVRGLVLLHNAKGAAIDLLDVRRWIRLSREVFKTEKIDLLTCGTGTDDLSELLELGQHHDVRLSLRTNCEGPAPDLRRLREASLFDVFLCPTAPRRVHFDEWLDQAALAGLPVRLQLQPPFPEALDAQSFAVRLTNSGVIAVNLAAFDPFTREMPCRDKSHSLAERDKMTALAVVFAEHNLEVGLLRLPFCMVEESERVRTINSQQFFLDHQQYRKRPYELACSLYHRRPREVAQAVQILLARHTLHRNPVDDKLLPWLLSHSYVYLLSLLWRKLTRHMSFWKSVAPEVKRPQEAYQDEVEALGREAAARAGRECSKCRLRRICDHATAGFRRMFPGLDIQAEPGELILSPMHFCQGQPKFYDEIDSARLERDAMRAEVAERAQEIVANDSPTQVLTATDYSVLDTHFDRMEGGLKWYSVSNVERISTVLGRFEPPLTVSVACGGGIADYVGFSFGRHCKLLTPMEAYRHTVTVHVDEQGRYALLRDGRPVRPVEFEGRLYLPTRIGGVLEPRLSIWNIEDYISTQNVFVWQGNRRDARELDRIKYSVIIVSTRFTRRLQAVLRCIAHQEGFDLTRLEAIVCYVPGLDATDDLLDSASATYPQIRIVRSPFAQRYANSKGFMINESLCLASGEWIMLLDSDTLLPPDMFAKIDRISDQAIFIAPDGRKLLPPETTARILMGELNPWESWQELLNAAGEFRLRETKGVPVGFCQIVRKECLEEFPYHEVDHFELADMYFGHRMIAKYGRETRLSGVPVLHLDHGGSQWYGTQRHL